MRQSCLFCACFLLLTLTLASYGRADDEAPILVQRFSDRVIFLTDDSTFGETTVAVASNRGLVVIDTSGSPESAIRMRRAIEEEFGRSDFAYVINTHHHWDHTSGNQAFADAVIIGHESCREWMLSETGRKEHILSMLNEYITSRRMSLEALDPESERAQRIRASRDHYSRSYEVLSENLVVTPPSVTFSDRLTLDLGDLTLSLVYFGSAHSESDILVHLPEEGLLIAGDLFRRGRPMNISSTVERVNAPRWIEALNLVLADENSVSQVLLNWESMITRAELVVLHDYLQELWEGVVAAKEEGLELDAALERLSLEDRFSYFRWFDLNMDELRNFHAGLTQLFWRQE